MKKFVIATLSTLAIFASSANAETALPESLSPEASCQSIGGTLDSSEYCFVPSTALAVPSDAKWVSIDGTNFTMFQVDGKNVIVYDGFLPRMSRGEVVWELLTGLLASDEIGCSGRYTC